MNSIRKTMAWVLMGFIFLLYSSPAQSGGPKNFILLVGDGMGPQSVGLAIYYNRFVNGMDKRLNMERLMVSFLLTKDSRTGHPPTKDYPEFYVYGASNPTALMGRLFGKEMNTAWAVGTHTHTPVMIFGQGPLAEKFRGLLDNVDVPRIVARAWGASLPARK